MLMMQPVHEKDPLGRDVQQVRDPYHVFEDGSANEYFIASSINWREAIGGLGCGYYCGPQTGDGWGLSGYIGPDEVCNRVWTIGLYKEK